MVSDKELHAADLFRMVQDWQRTGDRPQCPACGAATLAIKDVSARPHVEWYKLACSACGFEKTITRPMASQ